MSNHFGIGVLVSILIKPVTTSKEIITYSAGKREIIILFGYFLLIVVISSLISGYFKIMKILIIPDSFKGCLSAKQVANAIEKGILDIYPNLKVVKFPFSDGGEGAIDILASKI